MLPDVSIFSHSDCRGQLLCAGSSLASLSANANQHTRKIGLKLRTLKNAHHGSEKVCQKWSALKLSHNQISDAEGLMTCVGDFICS